MGGNYIAFFLILMSLIGILGYFGQGIAGGGAIDALPQLDDSPSWFSTLGYGFEIIGYFLGFQGLQIFGLPAFISNLIALVLNGIMIYVLVRLVRGGG